MEATSKKRGATEEAPRAPPAALIPPKYDVYDVSLSDFMKLSSQKTGNLDVRVYQSLAHGSDVAREREAIFKKMLFTQQQQQPQEAPTPVKIKTEPTTASDQKRSRLIKKSFLRGVRDALVLKSYDIGKIARQITLMVYEKNCKPGAPVSLAESMQKTKPLITIDRSTWNEFSAHVRAVAASRLDGVGSGLSSQDNLLMVCKNVNFSSFDPQVLAYELRQMCNTYYSEKNAPIGLLRVDQNIRYLVTQLLVVMNRAEALSAINTVFY